MSSEPIPPVEASRLKTEWGSRVTALRRMVWPTSRRPLADELGITEHAVGRWERGEVMPSALELVRLARIFRVDETFLIRGGTNGLPDQKVRELRHQGIIP